MNATDVAELAEDRGLNIPYYHARMFASRGVRQVGDWSLKWYEIQYDTSRPVDDLIHPAIVRAAEDVVAGFIGPMNEEGSHYGVGYVIVHEGKLENWILVNWWTAGIIGCELMARSRKTEPGSFEIYTGVGMACVFELEIVAFERDAWIRHALKGGGRLHEYLQDHLPDGLY
jgi:hypothetical protein